MVSPSLAENALFPAVCAVSTFVWSVWPSGIGIRLRLLTGKSAPVFGYQVRSRSGRPRFRRAYPVRRRILIVLIIDQILRHGLRLVTEQNTTALTPVFGEENPYGRTGQMRAWCSTKPNTPPGKPHIGYVVGDSAWQQ